MAHILKLCSKGDKARLSGPAHKSRRCGPTEGIGPDQGLPPRLNQSDRTIRLHSGRYEMKCLKEAMPLLVANDAPLDPPLNAEDQAWVNERLITAGLL